MKIEVSNGELIDKITILEIKLIRITDPIKHANIRKEFSAIKPLADSLLPLIGPLYLKLVEINGKLWEIEDLIRGYEKLGEFGPGFIEAARSVYRLNDERAGIKKEINRLTGSDLAEEKSYSAY